MKSRITNSSLSMIVLATVLVLAMNTAVFAASGTWTFTGNLHSSRDGHTATLLHNGTVLVVGENLTTGPSLLVRSTARALALGARWEVSTWPV